LRGQGWQKCAQYITLRGSDQQNCAQYITLSDQGVYINHPGVYKIIPVSTKNHPGGYKIIPVHQYVIIPVIIPIIPVSQNHPSAKKRLQKLKSSR